MAFASAIFLVTVPEACSLEQVKLDVKLYPQEKTNWCWAACGQTIMSHFGDNVRKKNKLSIGSGLPRMPRHYLILESTFFVQANQK